MSDPADFVARFAAFWRAPSVAGLDTLLAEDVRLVAPLTPTTRGLVAGKRAFAGILELTPDLSAEIHRWGAIEEGVLIEFTLSGSSAGVPISWTAVDRIALREDGLASERVSYFDATPLVLSILRHPAPGLPSPVAGCAAPDRRQSAAVAEDLPILLFPTPAELEAWLERHHRDSDGFWLQVAKKGSGEVSVSYAEALELALCFGWIDSQKRSHDEDFFLQRFTPRRPRGRWSRINREKAEALLAAGAVRPAGLAEIEAAQADGRWEAAYAGQRTAKVPADLQRELDASPAAREFFASLDSANRYAILYRLDEAKKPETRARRLRKFVAMLERGEKIHA